MNLKNESPITITNHRKMNICLITSSFPAHPDDHIQAPFVIDFIGGLQKRGHRVFVFTQDRPGRKEEFLKEVKIQWFRWLRSRKPLVHLHPLSPLDALRIGSLFWGGRKEIVSFVRTNKIEVCLALWVLPAGYFANYVLRKTGIPYSVWALGSDVYRYGQNPLLRPILKKVIGEARGVFADGFDMSRRIEERLGRKCHFLATTRRLKSPEGFENEGKADGVYRFLFVGRLERVKGIDLLLQALKLLKEEAELPFHLTIVGRGTMEGWAKTYAWEEGIEEKITFAGLLPDYSLLSLYRSTDCVVIPSRSESIPLVFSEALQFDTELIVSDVGDMGMLGRTYEVAEVVPPNDPVALKDALRRKILSQGNKKRGNRREEVLRLFDIETSVERFLEDYKDRES